MGERPERLSAAELAARSAVPVQTVNDLARAGVLRPARDTERPYSPADVMRVELALATERTGIPPAELGAAIAAGELSLGYLDALPPPPPVLAETVGEVASRLGLPFEELNRTIASFGLPVPAADDPARVDDAYVYEVIEAFIGAGLEGEALYAVCRIYSEAIRHLAQYQVDLFHTRFEQPYSEEA